MPSTLHIQTNDRKHGLFKAVAIIDNQLYVTGRFTRQIWNDKLDDYTSGITIYKCPSWFWDCSDKSEIEQLMEDYCSEDTRVHLVKILELLYFPQTETVTDNSYTVEEVVKTQEEELKTFTITEVPEEEEAEEDERGNELAPHTVPSLSQRSA